MAKRDRECAYCIKMFDCKVEEKQTNCINFEVNPCNAEQYKEYVKERIDKEVKHL